MVEKSLILSKSNLSTVSFAFGLPLGAATEPFGGVTELITTHMLRNTAKRNENEMAKFLDKNGIVTFNSTGKTHFYLGMNCPPQKLDIALGLFEEILFSPHFEEETIKKIVQQQMGLLQQLQNIPQIRMFQSTRWEAAFGKSNIAKKTLGNEEDLQKISVSTLESFYNSFKDYSFNFASIGVDISENKFKDTLDKFEEFGSKKPNTDLRNEKIPFLNKQVDKLSMKAQNAYLGINILSQGNLKSKLEDTILVNVLQGGFSSRMFMEIRDNRNLSYSVFALNSKYDDFGLLTAGMDVHPDRSLEALEVTIDLIYQVLTEKIPEDEMRRAVKAAQKTALFVSDSSQSYTGWLMGRLQSGREWDLDKENELIGAAAKSEWQSVMLEYWDKKNFTLAIAGEPGNAEDRWETTLEEKVN